jgi:predicted Zn-dependent peptidase
MAICLATTFASAVPEEPSAAASAGASRIPSIRFEKYTLSNGLQVILHEDHSTPIVAVNVWYHVGSKNERPGRTGFAHLFEHMMFKGSENVGSGEHFYLVYTRGGSMNGTTNNDRTVYFEILPKNQLDLGLFLEADRMRALAINKENLENQRQAVKEERRLGMDNQPYGQADEKVDELVYDNFAYHHSVIGSMADLDAASVEDVQQFFKTYYAPNNAVLALAGDLDTNDTLARVKKYFGAIPRQPAPKLPDLTEPAHNEERRATIEDKLARVPRLDMAYRIPGGGAADTRALSVGSSILGGGESSRLYQKLVKEKEVATQVFSGIDTRVGTSEFGISVMVRPGKDPQEVEGLVSEEIARLAAEPVSDKELAKARIAIRRGQVSSRESQLNIAITLADDAALYDDPNRINSEAEKRLAVTAADIQKAAKAYLRTSNRVVVVSVPAAKAPASQQGK